MRREHSIGASQDLDQVSLAEISNQHTIGNLTVNRCIGKPVIGLDIEFCQP